jgi:L-threonylcarbamoyladenylate synthase
VIQPPDCPTSVDALYGPELIETLRGAQSVEWFRIEPTRGEWPADESIEGYRISKVASAANAPPAAEMARLLLRDDLYRWYLASGCSPRPGVALRLKCNGGSVAAMLCFECDLLEVIARDAGGSVIRNFLHNFMGARDALVSAAQRAFPDDPAVQVLSDRAMWHRQMPSPPLPLPARAIELLRAGRVVAFPTETVYGLGADATNPDAVERIFAAKGRPSTNPLIVHVADAQVAKRYVTLWPPEAERLADKFWPGPLTLVLPRGAMIAPAVSAGRETVGLRAPNHRLALELLRAFDGPIAAPSANRSNRISPTTADHVRSELGDAVDLILDGGPCDVGIESTVLDLTTHPPTILRPGAITREQIEAMIGRVELFSGTVEAHDSAKSPGQHRVHYAPSTPAFRFEFGDTRAIAPRLAALPSASAAFLVFEGSASLRDLRSADAAADFTFMPNDPAEYAREIYASLHWLDAMGVQRIFIEMPPSDPQWDAIRDRLMRATRPL